ncbi:MULTISPECIES: CBS domain-containing protein [Roseiflexus]|jgi:CBS domain-containing protein|nr:MULTISPECIES: CBS domain-containing protein [Roseiflexus]
MDTVRDWMSRPPICISESTTLPEARRLMQRRRVRRLPVLDSDGRLAGIVTEGDINRISDSQVHDMRQYNLYHRVVDLPVRDFMTRTVITVGPDEPVIAVAQLLLRHRIGGVPVVEGEQVVGVITESDLFRRMVQQEAREWGVGSET